VYAAASRLYGLKGWAGFSIEALAREAGVGKSAIYLRWPDKAALLVAAFADSIRFPTGIDTGSVRGDLRELALHELERNLSPSGQASLRLASEARIVPEIAAHWEGSRKAIVLVVRAIVRRAIERGDLPSSTSVTLLLDALFGAVLMHVLTTPQSRIPKLRRDAGRFADEIVDFVLNGVRHSS
jgi:AcrR family transcriptional regulator